MSTDKWDCKRTDAAEFFGVSLPTIDAWIRKGAPVKKRNARGGVGGLNLADLARHRIKTAQGRDRDPVAERARRDSEAADKLALDNARTRGELLDLTETRLSWVGTMTEVKQRILALPASLAPQVIGATTEEARGLIEAAIHDALSSLADAGRGLARSAATAAAPDGERVGGQASATEPGSERGAGAMEH